MKNRFSWGVGIVGIAGLLLSAVVTYPANAIVGGTTASSASANVGVISLGAGCSGTLIHPQWVMTAWHCFPKSTSGTIQWGNVTRDQGTVASYSQVLHKNDLALARLDTALPEGAVAFPPLADSDPQIGATVQFFGFGKDDSGKNSPVLRTGSSIVVEPFAGGQGDAFDGPSWTIRSNGNGNPASGDSGGGAYLDGQLVGVISNADDKGANFASVAAHRKFIAETTGIPEGVKPTPSPSETGGITE